MLEIKRKTSSLAFSGISVADGHPHHNPILAQTVSLSGNIFSWTNWNIFAHLWRDYCSLTRSNHLSCSAEARWWGQAGGRWGEREEHTSLALAGQITGVPPSPSPPLPLLLPLPSPSLNRGNCESCRHFYFLSNKRSVLVTRIHFLNKLLLKL